MHYGGSRTSYNYDIPFSSLPLRNPSIHRVLNTDYGLADRSRDYVSRYGSFRPSDTSPTLRRREAITSHESIRSSHSDDLGYPSKPRSYYDFPSTTTGLFTSYTIKKPKRIDYSDYFRPVLSHRPMLKSGYCPRSQAERDTVSNPIVRERKLIKFREMSDDVIEKIRRKISWDLPEEITSPLIDEMKKNAESISESEQIRSRESSLSRRGSKGIPSPLSTSPRPSISRRSSGDQSLDRLVARRKTSSRNNSLIAASVEATLDSKAPIPPPRKKSIGSTHKIKKPRKSSIDILLAEEKTLNYSKVADDIRRSREISESLKKLENAETATTTEESNVLDGTCGNEVKTVEDISDRGRRRRRRESEPEPEPETRTRCRSRFRPAETPVESSVEKFEDETPRPVSRMHRKSVKYKPDALPTSKASNLKTSPVVESNSEVLKTLPKHKLIPDNSKSDHKGTSSLDKMSKLDSLTKKSESVTKMPSVRDGSTPVVESNSEVSKTLSKHKLIPDNSKSDHKGTFSLDKISKLDSLTKKSESDTKMPSVRDGSTPVVESNSEVSKTLSKHKLIPDNSKSDHKGTSSLDKMSKLDSLTKKSESVTKMPSVRDGSTPVVESNSEVSKTLSKHKLIPDNSKSDHKGTFSLDKISKLDSLTKKSESDTKMPSVRDGSIPVVESNSEVSKTLPKHKLIPDNSKSDHKGTSSLDKISKLDSLTKKSEADTKMPSVRDGSTLIVESNSEVSKTLSKHKLIPDNSKSDQKGTSSLNKISKLDSLTKKSESDTKMASVRNLRTDKNAEDKAPENKTAEIKKKSENILDLRSKTTGVNTSDQPIKMDSKIADAKPVKNFKIENREKETKTSLELPSQMHNKVSDSKKVPEVALKVETNDQSKSSNTDSKIKNTFTNKISKIGSNELEINSKTISEDAVKKLDSFPSKSPENKETKLILSTSISEVEAKPGAKTVNQLKTQSSLVEKNVDIKKSDIGNYTKSEVSNQTDSKGLRKFDDKKLGNNKQGIIRTPPIESPEKSSEIQRLPTESASKTKLPESKEVEEIVVVCKLPKKNDERKKSIPNEPKVIVSIKSSAIKIASQSEDSSGGTKDLSTEHTTTTIPTKQSKDTKLEICDSLKKQGTTNDKEPEINVTHTVVLKPKTQNTSVEVTNTCTKQKNENLRLKPIPDVIKTTVNAGTKQDSDISDIVKSTLSKADDPNKTKSLPLGIKAKTNTSKPQISNEKANRISSTTDEKDKLDEKVSKDATPEKNLSPVKKSPSVIFNNRKDETEAQNLKVQKSSTDYGKNEVSDRAEMKPDLIQMTAKTIDKTLNKVINQNITPDEKVRTSQNFKAGEEKSASKEIRNFMPNKDNVDLTSKIKKDSAYPNSTESVDSGSKRITVNGDLSNAEKIALNKTETKHLEGKELKIKPPKSDKIEPQVKSIHNENVEGAKGKIKIPEPSRVSEKDSINFMKTNKEVKVSESKIKPVEPNFDEKVLPSKHDGKGDESTLKKWTPLTPLVNDVKSKKNAIPAYKKSVTVPDIGSVLHESNSAEKLVSVSSVQKIKKDEPASLSAGNVPVTLLEAGMQALKSKIEAPETLKANKIRNVEASAPNKGNESIISNKLQLPKINDIKVGKEETKDLKDVKLNCSTVNETPVPNKQIDAQQPNKEPDQRKSINKKQKVNADKSVELKTETKSEDVSKADRKRISSTVERTSALRGKGNESVAQKSQDILPSVDKTTAVKNGTLKIEDATSLEKEKEKPNSTTDNLKLPAVPEARKPAKNLSQQELVDSAQVENKLDSHKIIRHGSTLKKEVENIQMVETSQKNGLEKPKEREPSSDAKGKENSKCPSAPAVDSNVKLISVPEAERSKGSKAKPVHLPPVPRAHHRYGLFVRPKDTPRTILQSSSSETDTDSESSETDTDSESSEEEPPPVRKHLTNECNVTCHQKCEKHMPNLCGVNQKLLSTVLETVKKGRSPDRVEKSRTQSETSNASIYSTLSNATTCTTFSTSSLDDDYSNRSQDKNKTLKFRKYEIDDFVFLKLLGKGSFGKVLLAELKSSEMYFAIKCLKKDVVLEDDDVESTMIERRVLALGTQHPYMCKLYCTFQTKSYLYFVMEYLNGGDLMFHIQETGRFDEKRAMFYGAEIVSALKFLHKRGIVYRDIKLDNIILDMDGHVHLVDFGMCKTGILENKRTSTFCGTPDYFSPEIVLGQKYNQSVDWWSFGVLLYEMLIGRSPFQGTDEDELFWSICNEEPHFPRFLSKEAVHILGLLLVKSPSKRLGMPSCPAGDIKDHAFFSTINWDKVENKQLAPAFKPSVSGPCDTRNFDSSFTTDAATLSPVDSEVLKSMDQEQFHGFSYTNPHLTG